MCRLLNILLLIAGFATTGAGVFLLHKSLINWLIVALGLGILGVAWYLDQVRMRQQEARLTSEIAERTAALTRRPWQAHERLEVPQSRWLFVLIFCMALMGGSMVLAGVGAPQIHWPVVLGGAFVLAFDALALLPLLTGIGKPALVLNSKGLTTPVDGTLPWSAVEGIYLKVMEFRGQKHYSLIFRVPDYAKAVPSIHWSQRWLALFGLGSLRRAQVAVSLRPGRERPETIEAVARHLWKTATGREHFWSPDFSADANDSFRRLATLREELAAPGSFERTLKDNSDQVVANMEQMSRDLLLINQEVKKKSRILNLTIGLSLAGMLLAIAWSWMK